jgi:hypothetical protein
MDSENTKNTSTTALPNMLEFRRGVEFIARYANNVQVEGSAWDLKLTFGVLDQRESLKQFGAKPTVEQHTSISLSWPQVEVLMFLIQLQVVAYEKDNGKIKVPKNGLPAEIPNITPPPGIDDAELQQVLATMRKLREEFVASVT